LTNLPPIPANWLTAAGISAGALNGKGDWLLAASAPPNFSILSIDSSGRVTTTGGGGTGVQQSWKFDTTTTSGDPGAGKFRFNTATPSTATQLYFDYLTSGGFDFSNYFRTFKTGDFLTVQESANASNWVKYTLTAAPADQVGWWIVNVAETSAGGSLPNNNSLCDFLFQQASGGTDPTWTTPMTESYVAVHGQPTPIQALYELLSAVEEMGVPSGTTTMTTYKRDGATAAMTFTLDDATNPTLRHRAT
jgi:hypothetical protein